MKVFEWRMSVVRFVLLGRRIDVGEGLKEANLPSFSHVAHIVLDYHTIVEIPLKFEYGGSCGGVRHLLS